MGVRKLQTQTSAEIMHRLVPRVVPADADHESVESPAALLQRRLDATLAATPWAGVPPPETARWPGGVRVSILLIGAASGWGAVFALVRALA